MDKAAFKKSNRQRRRIKTAFEIYNAIQEEKLFQSPVYNNTSINETVCYTCAIGASLAFKCDFNPVCTSKESNSQIYALKIMKECGFSEEHAEFIEWMFEDQEIGGVGNKYAYVFYNKYSSLRDELYEQYQYRTARMQELYRRIYLNKGVYPGYEGEL